MAGGGVMVAPPPGGAHRPASPDSTGRRLGRGLGSTLFSALLGLAPHPFLTAAPLALPLLIAFAPEAQAQTTTLVSNTGERASTSTGGDMRGTQFTTGANSTGYTISSVDVLIRDATAAPTVTIRANGTNPTGTVIATLTAPATFTANAVNTYTAPANTVLNANTTYWLRVDATSSGKIGITSSNSETGATGWSIANGSRILFSGSWTVSNLSHIFAITGQANPITPTVSFAAASGTVGESGGTRNVAVSISPAPTANITVNYTVGGTAGSSDFSISGSGTVTVAANATSVNIPVGITDDSVAENSETVILTLSSGTGYAVGTGNVHTLTITDNDTAGLVFSATSLTVAEESSGTYTVRLASEPTGTVTVTVGGATGEVTVDTDSGTDGNQTTLTFSSSNWNTAQPVTVAAGEDADTANDSATLSHTATGGGYNSVTGNVAVTVTDNDTAGLVFSATSLTVAEESSGSYTVRLATQPTGTVTVTVGGATGEVTVDTDSGTDGNQNTLTFSSSNWNTAQPVTVAAGEDADTANDSATLSHTATGGGYNSVTGNVAVTVTDNDSPNTAPTVANAIADQSATAGTAFSFAFPANTFADADNDSLSYSATKGDDSALPGWLTFTAASRAFSGTPQAGNVGTLTVKVTADDGNGGSVSDTFNIVVNAAPPALSISGDGAVTEGSEAVFTVTASAAQGGSQLVLYILSDATGSDFLDDALEGDNGSFLFPRNETSYSLRIATTDDSVEEQSGDITVTLRLRNGSNYVLGSPFSATVRVNDDDSGTPPPPPEPVEPVVTLPRVSISGGGAVTEGGDAVFTLTVSPPPPAGETVTVAVQVSQSGRVVASGESGRRTVVVDDRGAASFTVTTSDDAVDEPDGAVIVTVRNGNGYRVGSRSSASVGVNDDDPGLVPSTVSLAVLRGGAGRFSLKLDTAPTATVTVTVSVSDGKGWMVDTDPGSPGKQTTLLFTPTNWNQPQEVVVSAGQEGEGVATVVINASGGDYEGLRAAIRVEVVEQDQGTATEAAKGWQVRFGRTVAQQVVDAVQDRLTAAPSPVGLHLTVAGEDLSGMPLEENEGALAKVLGFETVTTGQVMQDSAFSFSPPSPSPTAAPTAAPPAAAGAAEDGEGAEVGEGGGPRLAVWGGGALSSFRGTEQPLSLDGNVGTALLGADWRTEQWQAGAALSHSWGNGSYTGEDDGHGAGKISSAVMTGLFPYGRYALSPRLGIWAVAGYGWGRLSLTPDGSKREYQPDATMVMGAVGLDGLLIDGGTAGLSLSTTTDLLNLKTSTTAVDDLSSTEGNISRLRVGLEAVRPFPLPNDASLLPSLEVGIRHDGGDAESGFGLEVGAALAWHDPQRGISAELEGRSLVTHVEEEFRQQGMAVSFAWEPDPTNRGPSLSMGHTMGATASGMDALLSPTVLEGGGASASNGHQFKAQLAYGFPTANDRLTLTPAVALALSPTTNTTSLRWSLAPYSPHQSQTQPWQLSLEGTRQQTNSTTSSVDHSLMLNTSLTF